MLVLVSYGRNLLVHWNSNRFVETIMLGSSLACRLPEWEECLHPIALCDGSVMRPAAL